MIVEIPEEDPPFSDSYGRCTFFVIKLAQHSLPVYQPGTVAFESGKKPGEMAILHNGVQANGPLLGNHGSIFLAKFVAQLVTEYKAECFGAAVNRDGDLNHELYLDALKIVLTKNALEDTRNHGRLQVLKESLLSLLTNEQKVNISMSMLGLFVLSDFLCIDVGLRERLKGLDGETAEKEL